MKKLIDGTEDLTNLSVQWFESMDLLLVDLETRLTSRQFRILLLKLSYYKGIEIAYVMGYSPATISKELCEIRKEVKRYLYGRAT